LKLTLRLVLVAFSTFTLGCLVAINGAPYVMVN
jgi:hypothetical protein